MRRGCIRGADRWSITCGVASLSINRGIRGDLTPPTRGMNANIRRPFPIKKPAVCSDNTTAKQTNLRDPVLRQCQNRPSISSRLHPRAPMHASVCKMGGGLPLLRTLIVLAFEPAAARANQHINTHIIEIECDWQDDKRNKIKSSQFALDRFPHFACTDCALILRDFRSAIGPSKSRPGTQHPNAISRCVRADGQIDRGSEYSDVLIERGELLIGDLVSIPISK